MFHSKLALVTKICFVAYKILNNFCFGEILAPVQILAEFCKTTEQVDMDCYCAEQGGALPPEQSRCVRRHHAPGHAAAWLHAPAVMWMSPSVLIHSPAASTARPPRFSLLCPTPTTRPRLQFHRTQSLSSQIEHSTTFATPL